MKNLKTHHWLILGGVVVAGYLIYKNNSKSSATVATPASASGSASFNGKNFTASCNAGPIRTGGGRPTGPMGCQCTACRCTPMGHNPFVRKGRR